MKFFQKYKYFIIGAIVLLIVWQVVKSIAARNAVMTMPNGGTVGGAVIPAKFRYDAAKVDRAKVFGLGAKNSHEVAYLQNWLNRYYNAKLTVDGDFGSRTNAALLAAKPDSPLSFSLDTLGI